MTPDRKASLPPGLYGMWLKHNTQGAFPVVKSSWIESRGAFTSLPMTTDLKPLAAVTLSAMLLGACAAQSPSLTTSSLAPQATAAPAGTAAQTVSRLPAQAGYRLSESERNLNCRTLTGRMAVRIVQLRDYQNRVHASAVSRGVQSAVSPYIGKGTAAGTDPEGRYARDRAQLVAYNDLLAQKECATFDLEKELDPAATGPPRTRAFSDT